MDAKYVRRFLRECKLAGKLRHHNIVFVIDAGISNGVHYCAMEYVKGRTLKEMLEHRSILSALEIARLALHMTLALQHAHENGVVHRDIKPSNIIISQDRVPKLCDFGLAKDITFEGRTTTAGMVMGTPHYISPEQVTGERVDIRSDIYSLGATLYHCACGSPPFMATCDEAVFLKHITDEPEPLRVKRPAFSPVLGEILHRMMRKEPAARFQTPDELIDVLRPLAFEESNLWGNNDPDVL
jgi:serine/threonine-protein kinase